MNNPTGTQPLASPPRAPDSNNMEFGRYPTDWYDQSPSSIASPQTHQRRRPSNPIAIPRPQYSRKPSVVSPVTATAPVICLKCGLHSRPTSAQIIETGGCSPREIKMQSYFPIRSSLTTSNTVVSPQTQHWPTDQCCEGWCPDTVLPPRRLSNTNATDSQRRRHHHRRRSSLYQTHHPVVDEEDEVRWRYAHDILYNNKNEADKIARKIVEKSATGSGVDGYRRQSKASISSFSTASVIFEG